MKGSCKDTCVQEANISFKILSKKIQEKSGLDSPHMQPWASWQLA